MRTREVKATTITQLADYAQMFIESGYLLALTDMNTAERQHIAAQFGVPPDWFNAQGYVKEQHRAALQRLIHAFFTQSPKPKQKQKKLVHTLKALQEAA